ncbi:MAG: NAD-dependent epimerase/dehydratase family protein, partial [Bacteroidales bacterium]|nr:NAD-dependent epimerase/dehydratase family protein [Bacteroidales bacterium]
MEKENKKVLVTGALGFIGFHLVNKLIENDYSVLGIDNINSYYDERMKYGKLPYLGIHETSIWPNVIYQSETFSNFQY